MAGGVKYDKEGAGGFRLRETYCDRTRTESAKVKI